MEFTEIGELNDILIYSKSYRPSLIPKFTKYFESDFQSAQDFNFVSMDELMENSFEDLSSPEIHHKPSIKISLGAENANETIDEILEDISNSLANNDFRSPSSSPKKKRTEEEFVNGIPMGPIVEVHTRNEESLEIAGIEQKSPEIKEETMYEEEEEKEMMDDKKPSSLDDKKNFSKLEKENISQTFTEKRKLTSCLTENIKNKGPVINKKIFSNFILDIIFFFFLKIFLLIFKVNHNAIIRKTITNSGGKQKIIKVI